MITVQQSKTADTLIGKRFNVFNPCADFPRHFMVVAESQSGNTLRVQNSVETYTVTRISFDARLDKNFSELEIANG